MFEMFQILSAEIDRVKKENDNMQIQLRPVFLFQICYQFIAARALHQFALRVCSCCDCASMSVTCDGAGI